MDLIVYPKNNCIIYTLKEKKWSKWSIDITKEGGVLVTNGDFQGVAKRYDTGHIVCEFPKRIPNYVAKKLVKEAFKLIDKTL
jgi:hypothetical protein